MKMKDEMVNLKQDNERLQRIVSNKSLADSQSSLPSSSQRSSAGKFKSVVDSQSSHPSSSQRSSAGEQTDIEGNWGKLGKERV